MLPPGRARTLEACPHPSPSPGSRGVGPAAQRRALLVHGLGSNGALMWRYGTALADDGLAGRCRRSARSRHGAARTGLLDRRLRRRPRRRLGPITPRVGRRDRPLPRRLRVDRGGCGRPRLDAAADPHRPGDPPLAARPRDRARQPDAIVRRPDRRSGSRRAPAAGTRTTSSSRRSLRDRRAGGRSNRRASRTPSGMSGSRRLA